MKKYLFLCAALLPGLLTLAQSADQTPYLTKQLSNQHITSVDAETSGGNITVEGVPDAQAKIEVYIKANNSGNIFKSKDEIEARLADYDLNIAVSGSKLTAYAKRKSGIGWNRNGLSISFKIYVPGNVSTELNTSGGNITLSKVSGTQTLHTSGGNLGLSDITGSINGGTSGGNIHLTNIKSDVHLGTSGGNIDAAQCVGNMTLKTSGGNLHFDDLNGVINATTSGGNVHGEKITGELITGTSGGNVTLDRLYCSLEASTSGGSIDISFSELGKYVRVSNTGGNIDLSLPGGKGLDLKLRAEKISTSGLSNFKGDMDKHNITGQLNGGGIPVRVDASGGNIDFSLK